MKDKSNQYLLSIVLAIAVVLRLAGITHDFPLIIHPDEPSIIRTALGLRFYLNPGHFDWPHLYMYLNYVLYMGFSYLRNFLVFLDLKRYITPYFPIIWDDSLIFYLLTRIFCALLGAATIIPVYLAGRDNFGKRVGLLAALTFCFIPYHVDQSHYALVDVPMTFFVAWGMLFAMNILKREDKNDYAGSGFYIGLATSTKYNGGLTFFTVPLAHLIRVIKNKEKLFRWPAVGNLMLAGLVSVIAFLIGTPYALLDFHTFIRKDNAKGALWQFTNVGTVSWKIRFIQFFQQITSGLLTDLGYTILIGFFITFIILLVRAVMKKRDDANATLWFLVITVLAILLYVSGFEKVRSRYFILCYPYIALVFAYLLNLLFEIFSRRYKIIGFLLFVALLGVPVFYSIKVAYTFSRSDTRTTAYLWLKKTAKPTDVVVFNDPKMLTIMNSLPNKKESGLDNLAPGNTGYLIYSFDNSSPAGFDLLKNSSVLKQVDVINNNLRLGPDIVIYSVNK